MHNIILFLGGKPLPYQRGGDFINEITVFFNFLLINNVSWIIHMRPYARWKTISYIFYVHWFLSNPPHLIVKWKLILIQNELWVQKCCANFKVF